LLARTTVVPSSSAFAVNVAHSCADVAAGVGLTPRMLLGGQWLHCAL
jgi:hypothetical protein